MRNGSAPTFETERITNYGLPIAVEVTISLRREENGDPCGISAIIRDISWRQEAEKTIKNQRNRLRYVLEGTNAGTWEWNVQTGETVFNERWAEILGYQLQELSPLSLDTWKSKIHPDDLAKSISLLEKHFAGETDIYECEIRMRHKNGEWIWVLDRGKVNSWTDDSMPLMMYGTHIDINDRKKTEDNLLNSEERFRTFSEQSLVGIYLLKDGLFTYVNPKFAEIHGYSVEECLDNMHFRQLVHPEDLDLVRKQVQRRITGEVPSLHYEFRALRKDGEIVHLEVFGSSLILHGELLATGTVVDITDRKLAANALKISEKRNRQILQTAMDGFWRADADGLILEVNAAYCRMSGYEEQELLSMNITDQDVTETSQDLVAHMKVLAEQGSDRFESRHRRKDGSLFDVEVSVQYRQGANGGECVAFLRDITDIKRAEDEKERLETSLRQAQKLQAGRYSGQRRGP